MKRMTGIAALMLLATMPRAALADSGTQQATPDSPASAPANPPAVNKVMPPQFRRLDANHDGYVSKAEAAHSPRFSANFDKLDTNHDGRISVDEFRKGMADELIAR